MLGIFCCVVVILCVRSIDGWLLSCRLFLSWWTWRCKPTGSIRRTPLCSISLANSPTMRRRPFSSPLKWRSLSRTWLKGLSVDTHLVPKLMKSREHVDRSEIVVVMLQQIWPKFFRNGERPQITICSTYHGTYSGHVWSPGICHCWSNHMEQSSNSCPVIQTSPKLFSCTC